MTKEWTYEIAENYEDLFSGLFCTNCFHLIADHRVFQCTGEANCRFTETKDNMFIGCDCTKLGTDFKMTINPDDLLLKETDDTNSIPTLVISGKEFILIEED